MDVPNEAQRLIESHISTLDQHKGQLERALAHLDGSADDKGRGGGQGGRGQGLRAAQEMGRAGRGRDRSSPDGGDQEGGLAPRGARRAEVIADLEANPGSKAAEIAKRTGINPKHAGTILANLVKQGIATKEGPQFTVISGRA